MNLGRQSYSLGAKLVRERKLTTVLPRFDPSAKEWVFLTPLTPEEEIARRPPKGLDLQSLAGLSPSDSLPAQVAQLPLPLFDLNQRGRSLLDS